MQPITEALAIVLAAVIGIAWPLYDYFVDWPRFLRDFRENPHRARTREYNGIIVVEWALTAACLWLWRSPALAVPAGQGLWIAIVALAFIAGSHGANIVKASLSERTRAWVRQHMTHVEPLLPANGVELTHFLALSLTAGVCEELLFRGYLIWVLAPPIGWWGAAAIALISFAFAHAYQGRKGMIQSFVLGAIMTALVAFTGSLLLVIILHALIDAGSGVLAWISLRKDGTATDGPRAAVLS